MPAPERTSPQDHPRELRARLALRAAHEAFLAAAGVPLPDPDLPVDPGDCSHPIHGARFDGLMVGFDELFAQVTCGECHSSLVIPVRADVAARHGGPRGPESDSDCDAPMGSTIAAAPARRSANHGG